MKFGFIIDDFSQMKPEKDTSFDLMLGVQAEGHEVYSFTQEAVEFLSGKVRARVKKLSVQDQKVGFINVVKEEVINLAELDVIFVRKDPPFDQNYLYMTLLLDQISGEKTRVINSPSSLRNCNEKMAAHYVNKWTPETLISANVNSIKEFLSMKKHVVAKPLDGHGGRGIFFLKEDNNSVHKILSLVSSGPYLFQEYCVGAEKGDKRILLLDGDPIGAILRIAAEVGQLNNLDQGGKAVPVELSDIDYKICSDLKPFLQAEGIFFAGIDLLGEKLTEINVTSPTGLRELSRFSNTPWNVKIVKKITG